jgi:hypothetical protein
MFANPTNVGISQRVVATLVVCAVVLMSVGIYNVAQAANLTGVKDTLSDSDLNVVSNHTIEFVTPTGVAAGQTITVTFPAGFNMGSVVVGDIDLKIATVDQTLVAGAPGATEWGYTRSGQVMTFTAGASELAAATNAIEIQIGSNATFTTTGVNKITNPNAVGSVELIITAGTSDTGRTRVAIIDDVLVTAIVDTTFLFTITGTATSTFVDSATTTGDTSSTLIDFGQLVAGVPKLMAQRLNVTTNAANGFNVTVETGGTIASSNGADIDIYDNGVDQVVPAPWSSPDNSVGLENTYGHWGVTTMDNVSTFTPGDYIAASTTPRSIFAHTTSADGVTNDVGSTTVAYKIQISPLQEAANDYNATLTYIATPTF